MLPEQLARLRVYRGERFGGKEQHAVKGTLRERHRRRIAGGFLAGRPDRFARGFVERHAGGTRVEDEQFPLDQRRTREAPLRNFCAQFIVNVF